MKITRRARRFHQQAVRGGRTMYYLRSTLRMRRGAVTILYDAAGQRFGEIRTDPKTGKRTRVLDP